MSAKKMRSGVVGRNRECEQLDSLLRDARSGQSGVIVLRGAAGIGKTSLLDYVVHAASGFLTARAYGTETETDLPYGALHQLCGPLAKEIGRLPSSQREALSAAFGTRSGRPPDRFSVGLAVLALLSESAKARPVLCCIDDAELVDLPSALALAFAARRLSTRSSLVMVFSAGESREPVGLSEFPELSVRGLSAVDGADLLQSVVTGEVDGHVSERIVAESRGNPSTLLDVAAGLRAADLVFGDTSGSNQRPARHPYAESLGEQVERLSTQVRMVLLAAALEPTGNVGWLSGAAREMGGRGDAVSAAEATGLIDLGPLVLFRHPLLRGSVVRRATPAQRRRAHRALAESIEDGVFRVWNRGLATLGPDEEISSELERTAGSARRKGGLGAVCMFFERAAELATDPRRRMKLYLAAAHTRIQEGEFDLAVALLARASDSAITDDDQSHLALMRAECRFAVKHDDVTLTLLLDAVRRVESIEPARAHDAYLNALAADQAARRLTGESVSISVARAASGSLGHPVDGPSQLLRGLVIRFTEGYASAIRASHDAVDTLVSKRATTDETLRVGWLGAATASSLWEYGGWETLSRRYLYVARAEGAAGALPSALMERTLVQLFAGGPLRAHGLIDEAASAVDGRDGDVFRLQKFCFLAVRGEIEKAEALIHTGELEARLGNEDGALALVSWARSVLYNGSARFPEALKAAREASEDLLGLGPPQWALAELVEAGVRCGEIDAAHDGHDRLDDMARAAGTDWALGISASRAALLARGEIAEEWYRRGIEHLDATNLRVELARSRLLFGEWLRRQGRKSEAREHLRSAYVGLDSMGVGGFAERARRELVATGERIGRGPSGVPVLTFQQSRIARLAMQGHTNHEIATSLYISPKTVEWHMRNVLMRLGVSNRRELRQIFAGTGEEWLHGPESDMDE